MRLIVFFSLILTSTAFAVGSPPHRPLITKTNESGFVPLELRRTEVCEVYENKVRIQKTFGEELVSEQEFPIRFQNLPETVTKASAETLHEKESGICDAPQTIIKALAIESSDPFVLFATGACGSPRQEREGPASAALRDLVNGYCPQTFDFEMPEQRSK